MQRLFHPTLSFMLVKGTPDFSVAIWFKPQQRQRNLLQICWKAVDGWYITPNENIHTAPSLTSINFNPGTITNCSHDKVRDKIIHPFSNLNSSAVEIWEWISVFILAVKVGEWISNSHILLAMWLLIHVGIKVNTCWWKNPLVLVLRYDSCHNNLRGICWKYADRLLFVDASL